MDRGKGTRVKYRHVDVFAGVPLFWGLDCHLQRGLVDLNLVQGERIDVSDFRVTRLIPDEVIGLNAVETGRQRAVVVRRVSQRCLIKSEHVFRLLAFQCKRSSNAAN